MQDFAIRGRDERGISEWARIFLQLAVEKGGEVRVIFQVWVLHLVKVAAKDPAVQLEAGGTEGFRDGQRVECAPEPRHGTQRKGSSDVDLFRIRLLLHYAD